MSIHDTVLIGVDGGATEVKAHAVACADFDTPGGFMLRPECASRVYTRVEGFSPVSVTEQMAQRDAHAICVTPLEEEQAAVWVRAAIDAIAEVVRACAGPRALIGMGMPGLKTVDGRGIAVINNGPRILEYLARLQHGLAAAGVELVRPIARLGSDADYCGLGEEYAAEGLFREVENAYYIGGGTGVADALKLRGVLTPFDDVKPWMLKAWQMTAGDGRSYEAHVSARGINEGYARVVTAEEGANADVGFPERDAAAGKALAVRWMDQTAQAMAELIFERIATVFRGSRAGNTRLEREHPYQGTLLDRVVIGQRLGQIYDNGRYRAVFKDRLDGYLAGMIAADDRDVLRQRYIDNGRLRPGVVVASRLRAAPAIGAAVAAVKACRPMDR